MSTYNQNNQLFKESFIKIDNLVIRKDAREILNFTYQLESEGLNNTIVHRNLIKYALGQKVDTERGELGVTPFVFFLNKKIRSETDLISRDDVITYTYVYAEEFENKIEYTIGGSLTPPENYEAIAIGMEIHIPPIPFEDFENKYKIHLIQNEITKELKDRIKNTRTITLYYNK